MSLHPFHHIIRCYIYTHDTQYCLVVLEKQISSLHNKEIYKYTVYTDIIKHSEI